MTALGVCTPDEFYRPISDCVKSGDPAEVWNTIEQQLPLRYPPLVAASIDSYPLPRSAAVMLYRSAPQKHRGLLRPSLGSPQSPRFGTRLAWIASHAHAVRDFEMLGQLAYCLDDALCASAGESALCTPAASHAAETADATSNREGVNSALWKACRQLMHYFDKLASGKPADYVQAAIGYFRALPAGLAVPPELVPGATAAENSDPTNWLLLRLFWTQHYEAWKHDPEACDRIAGLPNPFLAELADTIRDSPVPAPAVRPKVAPRNKRATPKNESAAGDIVFEMDIGDEAVWLPPPDAPITKPKESRPRRIFQWIKTTLVPGNRRSQD